MEGGGDHLGITHGDTPHTHTILERDKQQGKTLLDKLLPQNVPSQQKCLPIQSKVIALDSRSSPAQDSANLGVENLTMIVTTLPREAGSQCRALSQTRAVWTLYSSPGYAGLRLGRTTSPPWNSQMTWWLVAGLLTCSCCELA